jgi:hypothetical protein
MFSARLGFMRPDSVDTSGLEPEVISWRDRVQSLENVILEPDAILVLNNLVVGLKEQNAWDKIIQLLPGSIATTLAGSCLAIVGNDGNPVNMVNDIYDRTQGIRIPLNTIDNALDTNTNLITEYKNDLYSGAMLTQPQLPKAETGKNLEVMLGSKTTDSTQRIYEIMMASHSGSAPTWAPGLAGRMWSTGSKVITTTRVNSPPGWVFNASNNDTSFTFGIDTDTTTDMQTKITTQVSQELVWLSSAEYRDGASQAATIFTGGVTMFMISRYQDHTTINNLMNTYYSELQGLNLS